MFPPGSTHWANEFENGIYIMELPVHWIKGSSRNENDGQWKFGLHNCIIIHMHKMKGSNNVVSIADDVHVHIIKI